MWFLTQFENRTRRLMHFIIFASISLLCMFSGFAHVLVNVKSRWKIKAVYSTIESSWRIIDWSLKLAVAQKFIKLSVLWLTFPFSFSLSSNWLKLLLCDCYVTRIKSVTFLPSQKSESQTFLTGTTFWKQNKKFTHAKSWTQYNTIIFRNVFFFVQSFEVFMN